MAVLDIVSIVVGALVIIGIIAFCIMNEKREKVKERLYNVLTNLASYVDEAEHMFAQGQGQAKLDYVIAKVKYDCITQRVKLTEQRIKDYIERILDTPRRKSVDNTTKPQVVQSSPNTVQNTAISHAQPQQRTNTPHVNTNAK